jgi:hypothetical protein
MATIDGQHDIIVHSSYSPYSIRRISFKIIHLKMVEAVGVEPTSEKTFNREHSCFFTFIFVSSSALRTDEDATTTSLINLIRPAQTEQGRPAYCATIGTGPQAKLERSAT